MSRYYYDDGYYEPARPMRPRMSSNMSGGVYHLHPTDPYNTGGELHRSRSQGHGRAPDVHIYNDVNARADPVTMAPPSPRGRAIQLYDAPYVEYSRSHSGYSHSRSRSRDRAIEDYKREQREIELAKERAIHDYERKKDEDAKKAKEAQEEAVRKWKADEEKKKKEEKEAREEAVRKWKEEEQKKKEKKEKEDEEYRERVRKDLAKFGFQQNQIDHMVKTEEQQKKDAAAAGTALAVRPFGRPVFPKIRKQDIAEETLKYYGLPWDYDKDKNFIIIHREMTERETDILFEHTRRLRNRTTLTIEDRGRDKPEYAWVRRKSSRGKSPRREKLVEKLFMG